MTPILSIRNLTVALPKGGDRAFAVEDVSLDLHRGEILCVVGASGSGKSILSAAVMGALPGRLAIAGGEIRLGETLLTGLPDAALRRIRGNRIAMIPQEPIAALNPAMTVSRQIEEVFELHSDLARPVRRARARDLLEAMHLPDIDRVAASYPHQLSGGQCQRIAIAMGLAMHPDVLIADEPTTALDATTQAQILKLIRELKATGEHGVLFITHDFGVVRDIADRIAVMEAGRIVEVGEAARVLAAPQHPYTRALLAAVPRLEARAVRPAAEAVLTAKGLTKSYGAKLALDGVDISLERGTTLAIVGESGSGKSTLARLLVRIAEPTGGSIDVGGANFLASRGSALRRSRRQIQMIFQDPFGALNPRRTAGDIIARAATLGGIHRAEAKARALELLALVGLPADAYDRRPAAFSGGQRQRIGIARALAMAPQILICDESVSALDVLVQAQVLELLADLQARLGIAILFITHDLRTAGAIADRIAVMQHGRIVEQGDAPAILSTPAHDYTRALVAAIPGLSATERALGPSIRPALPPLPR